MEGTIQVIGTSHIAKESLEQVEKLILEKKPDIIAVELDRKRLYALFQEKKEKAKFGDIRRIGFKGYLFVRLGEWAERKMGNLVGVAPGAEMKKAVELARSNNIPIALIDQDIEITLKKFSKRITWREKFRFVGEIVRALFGKKTAIAFDLTKVPSKKIIKKLIDQLRDRYPNVHAVLIDERNHFMAHRLNQLAHKNPGKHIIAFVGAGHEDGIKQLLTEQSISYSFRIGT